MGKSSNRTNNYNQVEDPKIEDPDELFKYHLQRSFGRELTKKEIAWRFNY